MPEVKHNTPPAGGGCPTAEQLEAFAGGDKPGDFAPHIQACPRCSEMVREIRNNDSFLMGNRDSLLDYLGERPSRVDTNPPVVPGYTILGEVARGGQGIVLRAVQDATKRKVAIKILNSAIADDPEMLERFLREARSAAAVRSSVRGYASGGWAPGDDELLRKSVEAIANGLGEGDVSIRLLQKNGMSIVHEFGIHLIHAVPAREDYFEPGFAGLKPFCQIHSRHTFGHDHIGDQKINRTGLAIPNIKRFVARARFEDAIAAIFQNHLCQIA